MEFLQFTQPETSESTSFNHLSFGLEGAYFINRNSATRVGIIGAVRAMTGAERVGTSVAAGLLIERRKHLRIIDKTTHTEQHNYTQTWRGELAIGGELVWNINTIQGETYSTITASLSFRLPIGAIWGYLTPSGTDLGDYGRE